jgi:signal transduction histidine kinase
LAIVAEIVAAHHGRVWLEDRPGGGARVVVTLPLDKAGRDQAVVSR